MTAALPPPPPLPLQSGPCCTRADGADEPGGPAPGPAAATRLPHLPLPAALRPILPDTDTTVDHRSPASDEKLDKPLLFLLERSAVVAELAAAAAAAPAVVVLLPPMALLRLLPSPPVEAGRRCLAGRERRGQGCVW